MSSPPYAHTPRKNSIQFHGLKEHLLAVANLASEFARSFGCSEIAWLLGMCHDLGKADPRFQSYLRDAFEGRHKTSCPHAYAGAEVAKDFCGPFALAVAGHHAGMPDCIDWWTLDNKDQKTVDAARALAAELNLSTFAPEWKGADLEMRIRFCFSALTDSDYLDTENHFSGPRPVPSFETLHSYDASLQAVLSAKSKLEGSLNQTRREILARCLKTAAARPGLFRLTVPTGGGKTLSGLAFALRHAIANELRRVIVAIPYTSIIDQTAEVYEDIFGQGNVLEHHSAIEYGEEEDAQTFEKMRRLAAENWDFPLIVTTTVQLFESLFSDRPSRCRKLHNIAGSVIIVDEVQTLPTHLLAPILDGLNQLIRDYGCSVVLCTATQPDYKLLDEGFGKATEIVPDFQTHFRTLHRVRVTVEQAPWDHERLARELEQLPQCLAILNSRKDARKVAELLPVGDTFHLSTMLCPHHRKQKLAEVKRRLEAQEPVRLVSTQVVEAGVDIDFPKVFRAMGPLDRIVQAAGRCNREGKLPEGQCVVLRLEGESKPSGAYANATANTEKVLRDAPDPIHPDAMLAYSSAIFRPGEQALGTNIQRYREELKFEAVAKVFRFIEDQTVPLAVVNYRVDGRSAVEEALSRPEQSLRDRFRKLAPYSVAVRQRDFNKLQRDGLVEEREGIWLYHGAYDDLLGLAPDLADPADLVR